MEIPRTELARQEVIGLGIPALVIRAIQNPDQAMRMLAQHDIEAASAFGAQDLAPVSLAYRGELVGGNNSALEQIEPAKILHPGRLEIFLGQICQLKIKAPETPLLRQMVNGQHGGKREPLLRNQDRNEGRGPIMDMQNLGGWRPPPGT